MRFLLVWDTRSEGFLRHKRALKQVLSDEQNMSCSRFVKDRAGYLERKNALRGFFDGEKAFPSDCVKIKCRFRIVFHAHSHLRSSAQTFATFAFKPESRNSERLAFNAEGAEVLAKERRAGSFVSVPPLVIYLRALCRIWNWSFSMIIV